MARSLSLALAAGLALACGPRPVVPAAQAPAVPPDANILVVIAEAVGNPDEDTASYTKVFVDGNPAGETAVGPKSREKRWGARLSPGNHLFRFEKWDLPSSGEWAPLDSQWQPTERFIRVEDATRAVVALKFYDGGRGSSLDVSREPLPEAR